MIEIKGNLWDHSTVAITTNGFVKNNGKCVMGRGCAKEAAEKYPLLPEILGKQIQKHGNRVNCFSFGGRIIYTFPVKHNWWEEADLNLIEQSCKQLLEQVNDFEDDIVVLPRPGCGNGKLEWKDVKPILEQYLDDRFYVITWENTM